MLSYTAIGEALADVMRTVSGVSMAGYEVDDRDIHMANMPLIDVRLVTSDPEIRAGQDYFTDLIVQVDIYSFDLSSNRQAAIVRDTVMKDAQNAVRANPSWHIELETSILGPVELLTAKDEDTGGFEARATFQVIAKAFTDRA